MPKQPRLIPDPPNPLTGDFSQKRVKLSSLTLTELTAKWHQVIQDYSLAKDTASASVTVCPPSEKRRASKRQRNLGRQKAKLEAEIKNRHNTAQEDLLSTI